MKFLSAIVLSLSSMVVICCQSPQGGGVSRSEGFTIQTPALPMTIKQGETKSVTITLNRGDAFKRDVTLEIRASKGIGVEPTSTVVKGNENADVQLRISAAKDADYGAYQIFVKGTPETGETTSTQIEVKVVSP